MNNNSDQGGQSFSSGNYDTGQISSWIKGTKDPQILAHLAREAFGQISDLDPTARRQVVDTLRNDVKFQNVVTDLMPQTA